ncbi:MAG: RhtB family transporter [Acidiferrobacteraceae bacterium]|nr:RhtB family transporter [Acidiferrobacteraceae bacterium]
MVSTPTLFLFIAAAITLLVIPGPAVFYIVARSTEQGILAGLTSVLGIVTGGLVHVLASALGLSALVLASPAAFATVKLCGAAYLFYLGARLFWRSAQTTIAASANVDQLSLKIVYWEGFLVNISNPKTILFFVAFLPQFIDERSGNVVSQIIILGIILVAIGLVTDSVYAIVAGKLSSWLRSKTSRGALLDRLAASVYIGLAFFTVFTAPR